MIPPREQMTNTTWRPTLPGGGLGEPVAVRCRKEDLDAIERRFDAACALPVGPERSAAIGEVALLLDFLALPGSTVDPASPEPSRGVLEPPRTLSDPRANGIGSFHADPEPTEVNAAVKVYPRTGSQRGLVLDAIAASGVGMIDEEIAAVPGVADTAHRTRRRELVDGGWVEDSGQTRLTRSGTEAVVWILTNAARVEIAKREFLS